MIHKAEGYYGVEDYAKLCGVSPRNIRDRIKTKWVKSVKLHGYHFISIYTSPPVKTINRYKPPKAVAAPVISFSFDELKEACKFARSHSIAEYLLLEAIIIGNIDGYIVGHKVFVKPNDVMNYFSRR